MSSLSEVLNFSWVAEGLLAGCSFPTESGHFQLLVDAGVRHLVTLTERTPPMELLPPELEFHHISVVANESPSLQQIQEACSIVQKASLKKEGVAVHCNRGRRRTGTILVACLIALHGTEPEVAIRDVNRIRAQSIETDEQEKIIRLFAESLQKR